MEKKTIGQFMAVLRKANGMTQKQLAEKLNVSDKAVSRWERDECAPDLTLIPVLAEIFGVTSDEILRGQRIQKEETVVEKNADKTEKQIGYLVERNKSKYLTKSIISIGISVAGLIAAMICNFGFLRAYIGFFIGSAFSLAAIITQIIFAIGSLSAIKNNDFESPKLEGAKKQMISMSCVILTVLVVIFAAMLPLIIFPWDTYMGIDAECWLPYGLLIAAIATVVCLVASLIVKSHAVKKGIYEVSEAEAGRMKLRKKMVIIVAFIMILTFGVQGIFHGVTDISWFEKGTTFYGLDDFIAYIETPVEEESYYGPDTAIHEGIEYYDEFGNLVSEEEAMTDYIYRFDGEEPVASYVYRNHNVSSWQIDWKEPLPVIQTYSIWDYRNYQWKLDNINKGFVVLYFVEMLAGVLVYREKIQK